LAQHHAIQKQEHRSQGCERRQVMNLLRFSQFFYDATGNDPRAFPGAAR
jgi:hypothetical protein